MDHLRPLFGLFFVLFKHFFIEKIVDFTGIRTRIVELEGEHGNHLTITTALIKMIFT